MKHQIRIFSNLIWPRLSIWSQFVLHLKTNNSNVTLKISAHSVDHIKDCDIFDTFAIKKYWHGTALSIVTFNTEVSELHNDNFGLDPFDLVVFGCPLQVPTHSDNHIKEIFHNFAIKKDLVVCGCPLPVSGNFYGNQFLSPMLQPSGNVLRRK